jgi:hypothetical protein
MKHKLLHIINKYSLLHKKYLNLLDRYNNLIIKYKSKSKIILF